MKPSFKLVLVPILFALAAACATPGASGRLTPEGQKVVDDPNFDTSKCEYIGRVSATGKSYRSFEPVEVLLRRTQHGLRNKAGARGATHVSEVVVATRGSFEMTMMGAAYKCVSVPGSSGGACMTDGSCDIGLLCSQSICRVPPPSGRVDVRSGQRIPLGDKTKVTLATPKLEALVGKQVVVRFPDRPLVEGYLLEVKNLPLVRVASDSGAVTIDLLDVLVVQVP